MNHTERDQARPKNVLHSSSMVGFEHVCTRVIRVICSVHTRAYVQPRENIVLIAKEWTRIFYWPLGLWACAQGESASQLGHLWPSGGTMRMLKWYPLVQAGKTKPAITTFSAPSVLRDGEATREEVIRHFVGRYQRYAHASIWYHLSKSFLVVDLLGGA